MSECKHGVESFGGAACYNCVVEENGRLQAALAESEKKQCQDCVGPGAVICAVCKKCEEHCGHGIEHGCGCEDDPVEACGDAGYREPFTCALHEEILGLQSEVEHFQSRLAASEKRVDGWKQSTERLVAIFKNRIEKGRCQRCLDGEPVHVDPQGNYSLWYHPLSATDGIICENTEWHSFLYIAALPKAGDAGEP